MMNEQKSLRYLATFNLHDLNDVRFNRKLLDVEYARGLQTNIIATDMWKNPPSPIMMIIAGDL